MWLDKASLHSNSWPIPCLKKTQRIGSELMIKSSHFLIDFAFDLPSSYADHYLNVFFWDRKTGFGIVIKNCAGCWNSREKRAGMRAQNSSLSPPPTPPPCTTYPSRPSTHWPREKLNDSIRATRAREGCTISEFPAVIEESLLLNYPVSHILFFGTEGKKYWLHSWLTRYWLVTRGWLELAVGSCHATTLPAYINYRSSQRFKKFKQVIWP